MPKRSREPTGDYVDDAIMAGRYATGQRSDRARQAFDLDRLTEDERDHFLAARYAYDRSMAVPSQYQLEQIDDQTVALHRPGKKSILGFRGTTTAQDAITDAELLVKGKASRLTGDLEATARRIAEARANDGREYSVAGHSLGGSIAYHVGRQLGLDGHVFNPYVALSGEGKPSNITAHIIASDPVSLLFHPPKSDKGVKYRFYHTPTEKRSISSTLQSLIPGSTAKRFLNAHKMDAYASSKKVNDHVTKLNQRTAVVAAPPPKVVVPPLSARQRAAFSRIPFIDHPAASEETVGPRAPKLARFQHLFQ